MWVILELFLSGCIKLLDINEVFYLFFGIFILYEYYKCSIDVCILKMLCYIRFVCRRFVLGSRNFLFIICG